MSYGRHRQRKWSKYCIPLQRVATKTTHTNTLQHTNSKEAAAGLYNYAHNIITVIPLYSRPPGGPENFGSTISLYFTLTVLLQYVIIIIIIIINGAGIAQSV
jgi:hypothetical protein